ncbi:hypothetical protein MD588_24375 [Photobacterium sp. SDRW27]|nr:hypothetical protein [Photobacterium obscurum]MCW8331939.1 hypothetical protein [Photobacterium obscurum]
MGASIDSLSRFENGVDYPLTLAAMQGLNTPNRSNCFFIVQIQMALP